MKKNWNNPELKNLAVGCTNEEGCPAGSGVMPTHDFGWGPDCPYYCAVCGGCKQEVYKQELCLFNIVCPIITCKNKNNGGCPTTQS